MTEIRKLQVEAEFADKGVATGLKGLADKSEQMGKAVKAAADDGAKALGGMGEGAKEAQVQVDRATKGIIGSIQRATAVAEAGGRANAQSSAKFFESLSAQRGISADAIRPYLDQLDLARRRQDAGTASLNNMGQSARATAAALRTVPAQFTDIITSLQGGQAPLTVLLQQGGQLKDQFGGAGNAARVLGGYVVGLLNPITVLAAAALGIGIAFVKGSQEAQTLNKTLLLTGNSLNTTKQDLIAITERLSAGNLTQSGVTAALNEIVASGTVGRENIERYTKGLLEFERAGGASVGEVVKNFEKLKEAPLQGLIELNKGQNFLTESVYQTVKALTEQGKTVEAARVAQEAYFQSANQLTPQLEKNLGSIERLWRSIKDLGKEALSSILSVGRELSGSERVGQIQAQLASGSRALQGADPNSRAYEIQLKSNEALRAELNSLFRKSELQAQINTQREQEQSRLKGTIAFDAQAEKFLDKKVKLQRELALLQQNAAASGKLETENGRAEFERAKAAIVESFKDKSGSKAKPQELREFEAALKSLADIQAQASSTARDLSKSESELEKIIASPSWAKYTEQQKSVLIARGISAQRAEDERASVQNLEAAQKKQAENYKKYIQDLSRGEATALERIAAINNESQALELSASSYVSLEYAVNQVSIARAREKLLKNQDDPNAVAAIEREIDALQRLGQALANKEDILAGQRAEKDRREADAKAIKDQQDAYLKSFETIRDGLTDALLQGGSSAKKFLVDLFKKTILQPLIQPIASSITGLLLGGLPGGASAQGLLGGAGGGGLLGSLFGGGGGGGIGGVFSGAGTPINPFGGAGGLLGSASSAFGTGIASAITGGLSAGFGGLTGSISSLFGAAGTGATFGGALSAGSIALQSGNILGGLSTFAGALGPIALGIGVISSLFKKKVVDSGIQGEFGGDSGFAGSAFTTTKRLFRSARDSFSPLDEGLRSALADQFKAIKTTVIEQARSLNLGIDGVDAVRSAFRLSTRGLNDQQIQDALKAELGNAADAVAQSVLGSLRTFEETITRTDVVGGGDSRENVLVTETFTRTTYEASEFARAGETASETLARLSTSLVSVNGLFERLGVTAVQASLSGGDRSSQLVDLTGGSEAFAQLSGFFVEKFFSDTERLARARTDLQSQLRGIGVDQNLDRSGFRNAIQTAAAAGNDALVASLLKLAPAFDAVATGVEAAQAQFNSVLQSLDQQVLALSDEILGLSGGNVQAVQSSRALKDALAGRTDEEQRAIRAQFERIEALRGERDALVATNAAAAEAASAAQAAQEAFRAILSGLQDQAISLQDEILGLSGGNVQAAQDSRALQEALAGRSAEEQATITAQFSRISALRGERDALASVQAASERFRSAISSIGDTRFGLENDLLRLQGQDPSGRIRSRELAAATEGFSAADRAAYSEAYDANQDLIKQIADLTAQQQAQAQAAQEAASAAQAQAEASRQLAEESRKLAEDLLGQSRKLRGETAGESARSFIELQSQFAIATAQAGAGDKNAAQSLIALSDSLVGAASTRVSTQRELDFVRLSAAASLESVAARFGGSVSFNSPASVPQFTPPSLPPQSAFAPAPQAPAAPANNTEVINLLNANLTYLRSIESNLRSVTGSSGNTLRTEVIA